MSIRLRLTLWYSSLVACMLLLFGITIYIFLDSTLYGDLEDRITKTANKISIQMSVDFQNGLNLDLSAFDNKRITDDYLYMFIYNFTNGVTTKSSNLEGWDLSFGKRENPSQIIEGFRRENIGDLGEFLIYEEPIEYLNPLTKETTVIGAVQVGMFSEAQASFLRTLRDILFVASVMTVVLAFSLGLFLAQKTLRPIENIIRATNRVQKGADLSMRIPREGPPEDEIGQLTETINNMLQRMEIFYNELDEAYRAQRRFVSDASHELRTPLTTIRGNVDLLRRMSVRDTEPSPLTEQEREEMSMEALQDISDEARRMSRLVNDMLSLARADAGYMMDKENVAIKPLVEEVVRRAQFLQRKADWIFDDFTELEGLYVNGNKDYLQQMLFIFIENAFKYTPSGKVTLTAIHEDNLIGLRVQDTGIGMNEQEVPYIFERFYRADVSRGVTSGTGLGLSIAKWIIDEHSGSVEVVTKPGEGTTFLIWLPLVQVDVTEIIDV
ncbi:sensor histidine kinase [Paenibacillus marinisediminis]